MPTEADIRRHLDPADLAELDTLIAEAGVLHTRYASLKARQEQRHGGASLAEVANHHGITAERVRQIQKVALYKLRRRLGSDPSFQQLAADLSNK